MPNKVSFFAINADDVPRARQFYTTVFGWSFEPWGPPGFYLISTGAEPDGSHSGGPVSYTHLTLPTICSV